MLFSKACIGLSVAVCGITLVMTMTMMTDNNDMVTALTTEKTNITTVRITRRTRGSRRTRVPRVTRIGTRRTRGTAVSRGPHLSRSTKSVYYRMLFKIEKALVSILIKAIFILKIKFQDFISNRLHDTFQ